MVIDAQPPGDVQGALASHGDTLVVTASGEILVSRERFPVNTSNGEARTVTLSTFVDELMGCSDWAPTRSIAGVRVSDVKLTQLVETLLDSTRDEFELLSSLPSWRRN